MLRNIGVFIVALLATLAIGAVVMWSTVELQIAPWAIGRVLHASDVTVESARDEDGAFVLGDVRVQNADGTIAMHVTRAKIAGGAFGLLGAVFDGGKPIEVALSGAHVDVAEAALDPAYAKDALAAMRDRGLAGRTLRVAFDDASATLGDAAEENRSLALARLHGTFDVANGTATYAVAGDEITRAAAYPFSVEATSEGAAVLHHLTAPALAVQPVLAIIPGPGLVVRGGFVRQLDLRVRTSAGPPQVRASGLFVHVGGSLEGAASRTFSEADGRFEVDDARLSVPTLQARLGRGTLEAYGEVRDLTLSPRWLQSGSRELALVGRTLVAIGGQPDLGAVTLDVDAPGIVYAHYHMDNPLGPREISVVAIDPRVPGVRVDTALAEDTIVSGGERTSALAARTSAVAGINGDYFDIGRSYEPQGMLMSDGKLLRSPADRATVSIHRDGSVSFGEYRCNGTLKTQQASLSISEYNDWPAGVGTVVTPAFGKTLRPAPGETFVGLNVVDEARHTYRVSEVTPSVASLPVRFGVGFGAEQAGALPHVGSVVTMTYGCSPSLDGVVAILGGGPQLLKDGDWYEDPHPPAPDERPVRWPVVAFASMTDGTLAMVAVDGRHPERALGMSRPEFGDLLKSLGGADAVALDSGGSVTLVSRKPGDGAASVRNRPSDEDGERWIADGLFAYSDAPAPHMTEAPAVVPDASASPDAESTTLETIVNPDLPGNTVIAVPTGVPSGAPSPVASGASPAPAATP